MILAVEAVEVDFHSLIPGMNSNDFGYGSGNFKPFGVKIGKVSQFTLYRLPEGVYNPNLLGNRKKTTDASALRLRHENDAGHTHPQTRRNLRAV